MVLFYTLIIFVFCYCVANARQFFQKYYFENQAAGLVDDELIEQIQVLREELRKSYSATTSLKYNVFRKELEKRRLSIQKL